jgi:hypothetical protein
MNLATWQAIAKGASQLIKRRIWVTMSQVKLQLQVIGEGEVEEEGEWEGEEEELILLTMSQGYWKIIQVSGTMSFLS